MAAFTAATAANINNTDNTVPKAAWQKQENNIRKSAHESDQRRSRNQNVGQNTILEKTYEFFQMCDLENKGFITRRDMQVRLLMETLLPQLL